MASVELGQVTLPMRLSVTATLVSALLPVSVNW